MFSFLARRAILGAPRVPPPRFLLNTSIKSPILASRTFITSQRASQAQVKPVSSVSAKDETSKAKTPKATTGKKDAAKSKKAAPKRMKPKAVPNPKPKVLSVKAPPRYFNSYGLFMRERTKGVKGELRVLSASVSQQWKALSDAEREDYRQRAQAQRLELVKQYDEFMNNTDSVTLKRINRERRKQGKRAIHRSKGAVVTKRAVPPFFRFIGEARNRPEFESMKSADISRECGKLWRNMSDAEKDNYRI